MCPTTTLNFKPPPVQVSELYNLLSVSPGEETRAISIYVDAWGLKRLMSLALRRWKAPIHQLRDPHLEYVCTLKAYNASKQLF